MTAAIGVDEAEVDDREAPPEVPDLLYAEYSEIRRLIVERNWDYWTLITGDERTGKSTLANIVAQITDPDFAPKKQTAFSLLEYLDILETARPGQTCVLDEAGSVAYARDSQKRENKALNVISMVSGMKNLHVIMVVPDKRDVDTFFRNRRVRAWLHVGSRGSCIAHVRRKTPYQDEPYWMPVFRHHFADAPIGTGYDSKKKGFLDASIRDARETLSARQKAPSQGEEDEPALSRREEELKIAHHVAGNDRYWVKRGSGFKVEVGAVRVDFSLKETQARGIARMARAIRFGE